jgi:hypothetical protein
MQLLIFRWALFSLGIQVKLHDQDQVMKQLNGSQAIFMYSHASNLDPVVVGATCPLPLRFVGKRILFYIPIMVSGMSCAFFVNALADIRFPSIFCQSCIVCLISSVIAVIVNMSLTGMAVSPIWAHPYRSSQSSVGHRVAEKCCENRVMRQSFNRYQPRRNPFGFRPPAAI